MLSGNFVQLLRISILKTLKVIAFSPRPQPHPSYPPPPLPPPSLLFDWSIYATEKILVPTGSSELWSYL